MPNIGDIAVNQRTGQRAQWTGQGWAPVQSAPLEASMRGRLALGMGPLVEAQQRMAAIEARGNPYGLRENPDNAAAAMMSGVGFSVPGLGVDFHPFDGVAKALGGQDFQNYEQAAKAFEAQLMPIMSGAAVSPSEAQRQIKAALPELGDSPQTLAAKARTRAMMLNGAAHASGQQIPYPDVPTWGVNSVGQPQTQGPQPRASEIPAGAISMLRQNPGLAEAFNAKYGQGAAQRFLGPGAR